VKLAVIVLGCPKNIVEGQYLLGLFRDCGFEITNSPQDSDIVLVHSCSFIEEARKEAYAIIKDLLVLKKQKGIKVFISGCLPQLLKNKIYEKFPLIDGCMGTGELHKLPDLIRNPLNIKIGKPGGLINLNHRVLSSNLPYAYLKIAEGCNRKCSFCIIPQIRGKYKSANIQSLIDEAKALAQSGVKELVLIAQDTTSYGIDLYKGAVLYKLLNKLSQIKDLKWIRLLYGYPQYLGNDVLNIISQAPNICKYIDIPIQHISKKILSLMNRPSNTRKIIENISNKYPQIMLRTSLIAGFPQENKQDINELINFIKDGHFLYCGVFEYDDNQEADASKLSDKIDKRKIKETRILIDNAQYEVFKSKIKTMSGSKREILILNCVKKDDKYLIQARTQFQAPEIDGQTMLTSNKSLNQSDFYQAQIISNKGYDIKALIN
jgi:ribosomal protein S12 methylthiotransferase